MAFEINDLKGFFILVLFAIPRVASMNINCSGRAFHCVNSTHFMICVDLGGGVSTTIDDFVIPCPATTVCHENNIFECDFPDVTTPSLQVIGVSKQSDTSETTLVTNSVITTTPTSDITSVFKENFTATTLPIAEDVTPIVKLEVLENIMNPVEVNSDNSTETSFKVTSNFIDSAIEIVKDKQTSNKTITTSATDNNYKNLKTDVETLIYEPVNTSSTDKSTFFDATTSVIGLINLISTDPPSVVSTKPSYNVLTSLDSSNDNIATTTEQYRPKEVTIRSDKVENATNNLHIPTDITFSEKSIIIDEVNTTLGQNTLILNNITNQIESKNQTSGNKMIAEQNSFGKVNNTNKIEPEMTKEYVPPLKIVNIFEPITVALSPQTTTDNTFAPLGLLDLVSPKLKQNMPNTNDYIDTLNGNTATSTINQFNTKLETTFSERPIIADIISTTPTQNPILLNGKNNDLTGEIVTVEKVTETNGNSFIPDTMVVANVQKPTKKNSVLINTEATMDYTTEAIATSEALFNNDSSVQKQTIPNQPLELIVTTNTPIVVTDNVYQIHGDLNKKNITIENISVGTIITTEINTQVINSSSTDIVNDKITKSILLPPAIMKNPAIEITTAETLQNVLTIPAIEVKNESRVKSASIITNEQYVENINNNTLRYNMDNTLNITDKTVLNASSSDMNDKGTESTTVKYFTIEISATDSLQAEFTKSGTEAKNELKTTNVDGSYLEDHETVLLSVYTTPASYKVTSDSVTNATIKDLTSQSTIVTNPQTVLTPETIADKTSEVYTAVTDPVNIITAHLIQPQNLETVILSNNLTTDQLLTTTVQDIPSKTTTNLNNIENSATTPLPRDVTEKTWPNDIIESVIKNNISTTKVQNTQDVLLLSQASLAAHNVSELTNNTPKIIDTTRKNVESVKVFEPVPTNTLQLADIYRASTTDYKTESSTSLPVDFIITNIEKDGDVTITTLSPQKVTGNSINRVRQLNTTNTTTETVSVMVPFSDTPVGYVVSNTKDTKDLNTPISQIDVDVNKIAAVRPIKSNNNDNTTTSPSLEANNIKDENITIVSVSDIVNSSGKTMPNKMLQLISSYPSSYNDYIKLSESQASSGYVTAANNVLDNNPVHVDKSATQKNPEVISSFAETKVNSFVLSTTKTHNVPSTEINKYISTEEPVFITVDLKHINPTTAIVDYVTEKTNDYFTTEAVLSQLKTLPNAQAKILVNSISSVPGIAVTPNYDSTTMPVYDEVTSIADSAVITSPTETAPEILLDNDINISTEPPYLTSKVVEPQIFKYNTESLLSISELPVVQTTTEPTRTTNIFAITTPVVVQPGVKTIGLPHYVLRTVNNNTPQSIPSLPIEKSTPAQTTIESSQTTKLAQTTLLSATDDSYQSLPEIQTTDLPQYMTSTVNNNIPQSISLLPTVEVAAAQRTTKPIQTVVFAQTIPFDNTNQNGIKTTNLAKYGTSTVNNNIPQSLASLHMLRATALQRTTQSTHATPLAQTTPLATTGKTNQGVQPGIKTIDLPQYVISTTSNNILQSMPSLPITEVTTSQITTEPTHTTNTFADITPLATSSKTDQNILHKILTKDLPQYATTTVTYNNPLSITDIRTETNSDSLTAPDAMVETIEVVGDKVSGTHLGGTILSDVGSLTVNNANYSVKSFTNHESIVVRATSKSDEQNTLITSGKPEDINKAEIVNHTESNWMPSDVNIDGIKIKESSIEESSVLKPDTDDKNKTLVSNSAIISKIQPKASILDNKFEYNPTTIATYYKQAELGAPKNITQSNTVITKENKNAETNSSVNVNIKIIDVKKYQVQVDSKNSYSINNTKVNITPHLNLSLQNSAINDELEQHLISTNHTITTEVQSHLNESDKQSNKTSYELTLNVTSINNQNLKSTKLNASSEDTTVIRFPVSVFKCSNLTRGKYADKKDCRKFYTCIGNLQPILGTCPNNTVFSEINKQCTRNLSHCVRNNQFRCLFEGRFSDFFKDNIYYICVKNRMNGFIRYKLQCQNSYHLNKDSVKCEKNEEISTQSGSSVSEAINDESKLKPKSEKTVSLDNFECEKEGKFPYAKDCSKYYVCTKLKNVYRRKILKCASDEVFDKENKKCVESDSGEC